MSEVQNVTIGVKEGYRWTLLGTHILIVHPDMTVYLIELKTTRGGDNLPRDTDKPLEMHSA